MAVSVATIISRIRRRLNEETQRFYPDSATDGLVSWYNEGAIQQHRVVLGIARQRGMMLDISHPYLRHFATPKIINIVVGTRLYEIPDNVHDVFHLSISDVSNIKENDAMQYSLSDHWFVENLPHLQPTFDRPAWTFALDTTDNKMKLQVTVFGDKLKPNAPLIGRLYYYRDITLASGSGNVDLLDPYNEGPIWYAVGQAMFKRGADPTPAMELYRNAAQSILAPPASAQAASADAQAVGTTQQVASGAARDSR